MAARKIGTVAGSPMGPNSDLLVEMPAWKAEGLEFGTVILGSSNVTSWRLAPFMGFFEQTPPPAQPTKLIYDDFSVVGTKVQAVDTAEAEEEDEVYYVHDEAAEDEDRFAATGPGPASRPNRKRSRPDSRYKRAESSSPPSSPEVSRKRQASIGKASANTTAKRR